MKERVIICDIPASHEVTEELEALGCIVVHPECAVRAIVSWPHWNHEAARTWIVFPGNGSGLVRDQFEFRHLEEYLREEGTRVAQVWAKRYWEPGMEPYAMAARIAGNRMVLGAKRVIIVDDVVSSGATCAAIRRVNEVWFPGATWHALTFVAKNRKLKGFASRVTAVECGHEAAINSLSTLVRDHALAKNYAKRNFAQPANFLSIIANLNGAIR